MKKWEIVGLVGYLALSVAPIHAAEHVRSPEREEKAPSIEQEAPICAICYDPMLSRQTCIHTRCTDTEHNFHTHCLGKWYAINQPNHAKCPVCRTRFSADVKNILNREKRRIREQEEAGNPALRRERENKEFWYRFTHFTALGLTALTVVGLPLVLKEHISGPGPRGPIFSQAMNVIAPITMTVAGPLEHHASRLEHE